MKKVLSFFRIRKCNRIFKHNYHLYKAKKNLSNESKVILENALKELQEAILAKNEILSQKKAKELEALAGSLLGKTPLEKGKSLVVALTVALALAILIRQVWFEPYEIPTGSMRPTLKEKDRLLVSKTAFGINIPLSTDHLFFSPDLVKRNGIVVFTGEDMDIRDVNTRYFYLFPAKKQYVKRLIGKPGDTLYFYGGLIYGMDKEGNDISPELQIESLKHIEHIPFLQFEGKVSTPSYASNGIFSPVYMRQMNEPAIKLSLTSKNQPTGELLLNDPSHKNQYADFWGIKNFGMSRILNKQQALQFSNETIESLPFSNYYLEIIHHPSLENLKIRKDGRGRMRPTLDLSSSLIPLSDSHLQNLFKNLYTVRFIVKNGQAYQYGLPESMLKSPFLPKLPHVPDGMYEFYYGKAYKISFQGIALELDESHPLYQFSPEKTQLLYNLGMVFDTRFEPQSKYTPYFPMRYVYFRNKDLYTMGAPIFTSEDPTLIEFNLKEITRKNSAPKQYPYTPFQDNGSPLLPDGSLDKDFIKQFGLTIPEKMYLALGDNHAVSADSREFGFVPQENLRGVPDWIIWPPGSRFGSPNQPAYPLFNLPRSIVWVIAGIAIGTSLFIQRRKNKIPKL